MMHQEFVHLSNETFYTNMRAPRTIEADVHILYLSLSRPNEAAHRDYLPPLVTQASVELFPWGGEAADSIAYLWPELMLEQEPDVSTTQLSFLRSINPLLCIGLYGLDLSFCFT